MHGDKVASAVFYLKELRPETCHAGNDIVPGAPVGMRHGTHVECLCFKIGDACQRRQYGLGHDTAPAEGSSAASNNMASNAVRSRVLSR